MPELPVSQLTGIFKPFRKAEASKNDVLSLTCLDLMGICPDVMDGSRVYKLIAMHYL